MELCDAGAGVSAFDCIGGFKLNAWIKDSSVSIGLVVSSLTFRAWGLGLGLRTSCLGFRVQDSGFRVQGSGFRV